MEKLTYPVLIADKRITDFMHTQTVCTMAVNNPDMQPVCASCFYVFDAKHGLIIFKSESSTNHISYGLANSAVGGTILPDRLVKQQIQGIQFEGELLPHANPYLLDAKKLYYLKYPFAAVMSGHIWAIKLNYIKFTDNGLGFGRKIIWERSAI